MICIVILILINSSCTNPSKTKNKTQVTSMDSLIQDSISMSKDSIVVYCDVYDTIKYSQSELNTISRNYPMLVDDIPRDPKEAYIMSYCPSNKKSYRYGSETGQDEFFILYGYFLKLRNGDEKFQIQRERLINIYRTINDIYGYLNNGGAYFTHQYKRIVGFTEYSIYLQINNDEYNIKTYDYTRQKNLYIQTFKQFIEDEISIDNEVIGNGKKIRKSEILKELEKLNSLISNYSDLKNAQGFQYSNY